MLMLKTDQITVMLQLGISHSPSPSLTHDGRSFQAFIGLMRLFRDLKMNQKWNTFFHSKVERVGSSRNCSVVLFEHRPLSTELYPVFLHQPQPYDLFIYYKRTILYIRMVAEFRVEG